MKNELNKKKRKPTTQFSVTNQFLSKKTKRIFFLDSNDRRFNFENKQNVSYFFSRKSSSFEKIASGTFELFVVSFGTPDNS